MGSPPNESGRVDNEGPPHVVTIARAFAVGKYEITFDDWEACVTDRGCARADVTSGRLLRVVPRWSETRGAFWLVHPQAKRPSRKLAAFRDFLVDYLAAHPL